MHAMTKLAPTADRVLEAMADPAAWDDARFDELARAVFAAQRASVPPYAAWCEHELASRKNREVESWRDIPALPIAAFRHLQVADPAAPMAVSWLSSGTTSEARSQHDLVSTAHYDRSLDVGVASALVPDIALGERAPMACVQLQPTAHAAERSSLTHMFDRIRLGPWARDEEAFVDGSWRLDARSAWSKLEALAADDEPVLLLATSFSLAMLLERVDDIGWEHLELPAGSRVVDTGGYKGRARELTRDELLDRVERQLGVPREWCENEYGMTELSSQAWLGTVASATGHPLQLPAPGARWTPPWLRVRVVDPETLDEVDDGEQGLLVFHDLANVWSCAAIRSEDLGIRRGRGFELVGRAPGAVLKGCSLRLEDL